MSEREWILQRVVVNDEVIDAGNPYDVIDPVWWTGDIYGTVEQYEASLRRFSKPQRLVYAALWYMSEVNNGGHHQFFFNSTGIVWPDALEAFREIGLPEVADIIADSGRRLGGTPSRDRSERQAQLDSSQAAFDDLDERLYAVDERVNLDARIAGFIRSHRQEFYFDGSISKPR